MRVSLPLSLSFLIPLPLSLALCLSLQSFYICLILGPQISSRHLALHQRNVDTVVSECSKNDLGMKDDEDKSCPSLPISMAEHVKAKHLTPMEVLAMGLSLPFSVEMEKIVKKETVLPSHKDINYYL